MVIYTDGNTKTLRFSEVQFYYLGGFYAQNNKVTAVRIRVCFGQRKAPSLLTIEKWTGLGEDPSTNAGFWSNSPGSHVYWGKDSSPAPRLTKTAVPQPPS